ncbi:MAG: Ig-like domain-containing protein [Anaerovoracaceae bacterium]
MKKNKFTRKILSLSVVLVMLFSLVIQSEFVFAEPLERIETKITEFTVTKQNGQIPPNGFNLSEFLRIKITWDASAYGDELKAGDYFNITLPEAFKFPQNHAACNFDILAPNGTDVVAKAVVTPINEGGGNIKVTFTEYVEDKYNIQGSLYLNANFNQQIIKEAGDHEIVVKIGTFTFTINVPTIPYPPQNELKNEVFAKWSGQSLTPEGHVRWVLRINHKKANFDNVVISDQLTAQNGDMDGIHYVEDSFELSKVTMDVYGNEKTSTTENISDKIEFNPDKTSFTYNLGAITDGQQYKLRYKSTYKPGLKLRNKAKFEGDNESVTKENSYTIANSGGQGQGDLTSKIKIVKLDSEKNEIKLSNAKFEITNSQGKTITLTTDSNGEALSEKLIPGNYKIKETNPPAGYVLNEEEYDVVVTSDGACIKEIKNDPIKRDITVKKEWIGAQGSSVTAILKADGVEVDRHELSAPDWTYKFENLRQYKPGTAEEIKYTVEEETVPNGYKVTYETDPTGVLIIKNTQDKTKIVVTKVWENLIGEVPTVALQLLKNGQAEGDVVTLINGITTHTWEGLDKTDNNGTDYKYTVKEIGENGNEIEIGNNRFEVIYQGTVEDGFKIINRRLPPRTPGTPSNPSDHPKDDPKKPPTPPSKDIPDDGVPKGNKTVEGNPSNPVAKNDDVSIAEDLVPKTFITDIKDNRPKLPQTGQNFWLIELLSLIGLAAVPTGIVMSIRSDKRN